VREEFAKAANKSTLELRPLTDAAQLDPIKIAVLEKMVDKPFHEVYLT
jgi:hypothetical protein